MIIFSEFLYLLAVVEEFVGGERYVREMVSMFPKLT